MLIAREEIAPLGRIGDGRRNLGGCPERTRPNVSTWTKILSIPDQASEIFDEWLNSIECCYFVLYDQTTTIGIV